MIFTGLNPYFSTHWSIPTMHTPVFIVAIVFGGLVMALAVICGTVITAMKLRRSPLSRKDQRQQTEEARMIQEIYHGLSKMEERIDSLETILMDRHRKDR
ncbi:MAG: phage-shock protein [Desulfobacteraceae bacterium]|nr:phage-shock protein [Desulfobacteraceae bacterium]